MNVVSLQHHADRPESEKEFALRRCEWLDQFARLESAACNHFVKSHQLDAMKKPFAQRLKDLASMKPCPQLSKEKAKALKDLIPECEALLPIRAALVHSTMEIGVRSKEPVAIFHNVADAARGIPFCLVLTPNDFDKLQKKLQNLTDRMKG